MGETALITAKTPESTGKLPVSKTQKKVFPKTKSSPANQILNLQQTMGNREVQRLLKSGTLQAKLTIGKPNDKYEQEADRVADKVMSMPEPKQSSLNSHSSPVQRQSDCPDCPEKGEVQTKPLTEQITPLVQRQVDKEDETAQTKLIQRQETEDETQTKLQRQEAEEEEKPVQGKLLQRQESEEEEEPGISSKAAGPQPRTASAGVESGLQSLKGSGQHLSDSTRSYFESRFGSDFSQVRVHTGPTASETAKSINAKAFTKGKDVVFGEGQYSPGTSSGKRLLAHELTHVVQQSKKEK